MTEVTPTITAGTQSLAEYQEALLRVAALTPEDVEALWAVRADFLASGGAR